MILTNRNSYRTLLPDDGKLKMEVTETTMAQDGEAAGKVTCKVIVGTVHILLVKRIDSHSRWEMG